MLINPLPYSDKGLDAPLNDKPWRNMKQGKDLLVLVDADVFVYSAGFVCEHSEPVAYCPVTGGIIGQWKNKSGYNAWLKQNPDVEHELDFHEWVEELDTGLLVLNTKRKQIRDATRGGKQRWYLTKGSSLWRNEYATIQGYKANRTDMRKPVYYEQLRDHMINKFGAKVLVGLEADDGVAAIGRERKGEVVIVSGDKDLRTIPGLALNPSKMDEGIKFISELEACRFLYAQMLMGDRIDNIKGLSGSKGKPGWGPVKSANAMEQFTTEGEMARFVATQYAGAYPDGLWVGDEEQGIPVNFLNWTEILVETANLLFLRRYEHTRFTWEVV